MLVEDPATRIPPWVPTPQDPITCDGVSAFPIYFVIPREHIIPWKPGTCMQLHKNQSWSSVIPYHLNTYRYQRHQEKEYHHDMKNSFLCATNRKGGWQSMRTLEIMANGCFPYFAGLEGCGKYQLRNLPVEVLLAVRDYFPHIAGAATVRMSRWGRMVFKNVKPLHAQFDRSKLCTIIDKLTEYSAASLVPEINAIHVFRQMKFQLLPRSVLLLIVHRGYLP
eukprot:PhF_6_TR21674/c0_g1_i2/m.30936